jgi:hypothetical protein
MCPRTQGYRKSNFSVAIVGLARDPKRVARNGANHSAIHYDLIDIHAFMGEG